MGGYFISWSDFLNSLEPISELRTGPRRLSHNACAGKPVRAPPEKPFAFLRFPPAEFLFSVEKKSGLSGRLPERAETAGLHFHLAYLYCFGVIIALMIIQDTNLLDENTPLVFTDGTEIYNKLASEYKTHKKGFFIIAPSGSGKTHFIDRQEVNNWIDGDTLWMATNAHPKGEWWLKGLDGINEIERRSDVITEQAKRLGFWIIGVDCYSILPDAVVIPDLETHKRYLQNRTDDPNNDGGQTIDKLDSVLRARKYMESFAEKGVPIFKSMTEATDYLASTENS